MLDSPVPPVFEIRLLSKPTKAKPWEDIVLVSYKDGKYIEAVFDIKNAYFEDSKESYMRLKKEGKSMIKSIKWE